MISLPRSLRLVTPRAAPMPGPNNLPGIPGFSPAHMPHLCAPPSRPSVTAAEARSFHTPRSVSTLVLTTYRQMDRQTAMSGLTGLGAAGPRKSRERQTAASELLDLAGPWADAPLSRGREARLELLRGRERLGVCSTRSGEHSSQGLGLVPCPTTVLHLPSSHRVLSNLELS